MQMADFCGFIRKNLFDSSDIWIAVLLRLDGAIMWESGGVGDLIETPFMQTLKQYHYETSKTKASSMSAVSAG